MDKLTLKDVLLDKDMTLSLDGEAAQHWKIPIRIDLTPALAEAFGCRDELYHESGSMRDGLAKANLALKEVNVWLSLIGESRGDVLQLANVTLAGFAATKELDRWSLAFRAQFDGYSLQLVEWLMKNGQGPHKLVIEPVQESLDFLEGTVEAAANDVEEPDLGEDEPEPARYIPPRGKRKAADAAGVQ